MFPPKYKASMKTRLLSFSVAVAIVVGPALCQTPQSSSLNSLVESERAFAAMSVREGMKSAFLAFLADDGIIFRPGPVNGKALWEKKKESTARLEWRPTVAYVSASGELGYTSGPWIFTPAADLDQPPAHGYFVSIWKKQKDGKWKLAVDLGSSNEAPQEIDSIVVAPSPISSQYKPSKALNPTKEKDLLLNAEKRFSKLAVSSGLSSAFKQFLTNDGRVYRQGDFPTVGRDAVLRKFSDTSASLRSTVTLHGISKSCDLAYTHGTYSSTKSSPSETGYFVRIWRKQAENVWKLALEVLSPNPKEE